MRKRVISLVAAVGLLVAGVVPASAITFGQLDSSNTFQNVGALVGEVEGEQFIFCTGTLIADGTGSTSNVFLTAAHCLEEGARMWVTFDPTIDLDDETGAIVPGTSVLLPGTAHPHPQFACCGLNEPFDIGVVVLDSDVAGVTPAPLPTANLLDTMTNQQLKSQTFVTAGYGTVRDVQTKSFQAFSFDGDRRWATQTVNSIQKAWLTLSMNASTGNGGTCYGDSGGPHFLGSVVVSITSIGDIPCKAQDKTYRVDTPVARDFLDAYVALP